MKKKKVDHTTFRNSNLFCLNCGGEHRIIYPILPDALNKKVKDFNSLHADCKPEWKEPVADQSQSVIAKAHWWIGNGETGMSSKTIWNCLIGNSGFAINHPYDSDDFQRCYKLLQAVPEWKSQLHKLKPLSPEWSNLVDNWDKLTDMWERIYKGEKNVGMFDFMQTLIK